MMPAWEDLAESLDGQINIAKVDCTANKGSYCSSIAGTLLTSVHRYLQPFWRARLPHHSFVRNFSVARLTLKG